MRPLWHLIRKEVRQLFQAKYVVPLLLAPLLFVAMGQGISGVEQQLADQPEVAVVDADDSELSAVVTETLREETDVVYTADSTAEVETAISEVRAADGQGVVVIPDGFAQQVQNGEAGTVRTYAVIDEVSLVGVSPELREPLAVARSRLALAVTGATPTELSPVRVEATSVVEGEQVDSGPRALSSVFTSQVLFVPIVIAVVVLFAGQMVMNSMGIEKESRTLETLLTMPVSRRTLVIAKMVGSSSIGLFGAGLYVVSLAYYQSVTSDGGAATAAVQLATTDYVLIGVSLALTLVCGLALALCLGTFVDDQQGAQTYLLPLSALAFVPAGVTVFTEVETLSLPLQALLYLVPFTHPIVAPKRLLFGDPTMVYAGIGYQLLFAVSAIWLAVRIFDSDRIVTGGTGRLSRLLG
jgi:ABC-2 type transport system permease protein